MPLTRLFRFKWAHCQLEALRRCPLQKIRKVLKELPKTLDETYEHMLQGIDEEKWEFAYRVFQFLTVSARPLRVEEVAEVFSIQVDEEATGIPEFNARWRPANAEAAVLSACSSLITVVNVYGEKIVQFSHFSVQEFLTGTRLASSKRFSRYHVLPQSAHTFLAKACLSILLRLNSRIHKGSVKKMFPLADYAAEHWVGHARHGNVSSLIDNGMEHLFDGNKPHFAAWLWVYDIDKPYGPHISHTHPERPEATPLYYAALCGFHGMVKRLVDARPQDVNSLNTQGEDGGAPLHAALRKGHTDIALFLLQQGADANAQDRRRQTPLHVATREGYIEVIQSLITHGADPNAKDRDKETPLALASRYGRLDAIQLLLQHGADANQQGSFGRTPLHVASKNGHHDVARLLLNNGASSDATGQYLQTPLHVASEQGYLSVAIVLIEHGADVDAKDASGWTPLHMASSGGEVKAAGLMLDHNADVNSQEQDGWTALHLAAYNGHHGIVEILLERGADPHIQNNEGKTPLEVVSENYNAAQAAETAELLSRNGGW
jgi:ankyrin repeat protein